MKKMFSKSYMLSNKGCYTTETVLDLFFSSGNDSITIHDILDADIPLKDKYWFVIKKTGIKTQQKQQIAIDLADMVLLIFEKRYPDDIRPREAVEVAKQFIAGHVSLDQLIEKRKAAADAAADADGADGTSYAAANAAVAASYAASYTVAADAAAVDAIDAIDAASYAAAVAADAAAVKQRIKQYLIYFVKQVETT